MNISLGMDESVIEDLVQAFSETTYELVNEIKLEYGMDTGNFTGGGSWDIRFNRIKQAALQNDLVVLTRKRGRWTFICVLNLESGILYVFSKDKNFEKVVKSFGSNKIHYFHAFVSKNSGPEVLGNHQMGLFSILADDYEDRRLSEVQKILAEEYPLVNQVVFVVGIEEDKKIVSVEARLFNRYFELVDVENWNKYVSVDQYSDIFVNKEHQVIDTQETILIPKVKQSVKNRKEHFDKQRIKKKAKTEESKRGSK